MSRILVVDDDEALVSVLAQCLAHEGYEVATAAKGAAAIDEVSRRVPDLVLLDLGLPGGNGFKVLEKVRASNRSAATPVVVLTGNWEPAFEERALKAGATRFLRKPGEISDLVRTIRELVSP
jgi:two-component system, OmpR family, KDP operon response regulator KdpE